jgi:hypothetical protein
VNACGFFCIHHLKRSILAMLLRGSLILGLLLAAIARQAIRLTA